MHKVGIYISLFFVVIGIVLFLVACFYQFKEFFQVKSNDNISLKIFNLSALFFGIALFVFLNTVAGFAWENLGFSVFIVVTMMFFIRLDNFVRVKTKLHLEKNGMSSPFQPFARLFSNFLRIVAARRNRSETKTDDKKEL